MGDIADLLKGKIPDKTEDERFAELFVAMSTDFLMKKIDYDHYVSMLRMAIEEMDARHKNSNCPSSKIPCGLGD